MARQVQLRRGSTVEHSTFTGAVGEITVDTDKKVVVVHDGSTAGGTPLAKAASPTFTGVMTAVDIDASTLDTTNNASIGGNLSVTSNISIGGTLSVTGTSSFTGAVTVSDISVSGNLTVSGTTTTINTETVEVADNIITLNSNHSGAPSQDAGIQINRGSSSNVSIKWNETTDTWQFTNDGTNYNNVSSVTTGKAIAMALVFGG